MIFSYCTLYIFVYRPAPMHNNVFPCKLGGTSKYREKEGKVHSQECGGTLNLTYSAGEALKAPVSSES